MPVDWLTIAGSLAVGAITALLKSQGRTITATQLGQNADKYFAQNLKDLEADEADEAKRYGDGQ